MKINLTHFLMLFFAPGMFSQTTVSGIVTDSNHEPLPGVTIAVSNLPLGTVTDSTGAFALDVPPEGTELVFSCVGFEKTKVEIVRGVVLLVRMKPAGLNLPQVVVTALNIERKRQEIGHSTQRLEGRELADVQETNLSNSLAGKIAGLQVFTSSGNLGGSSRLVLRGVRSLFGENQPLFVIDGVPMDNSNFNVAETVNGGYGFDLFDYNIDFGNAIQDINPQDIAALDVLKGPAAAALYGSRGGNGAIVITTRRGHLNAPLTVTLNSQTMFEQVATLPDFQDVYGGGNGDFRIVNGELVQHFNPDYSWGPRIDPSQLVRQWYSYFPEIPEFYQKATPWEAHPDNVRDFFQTGVALRNALSVSGGTEKATYRFGYANLRQTGIYPNSLLQRHQFNANLDFQIRQWLHLSVNGNYTTHQAEGRASNGEYPSVTQSLTSWFQRQLDMDILEKYYVTPTGRQGNWNLTNLDDQRPIFWNNPYWEQYKNAPKDGRDRFFGNLAGTVNILPGLRLIGRFGLDNYTDLREQKRAIGSANAAFINLTSFYKVATYQVWEFNAEGLLEYATNLTSDVSLRALAGANQRANHFFTQSLSTTNGLKQPDVYAISNSVGVPRVVAGRTDSEVKSWFGNATLGFRNTVFLDLAARNDALSTLPPGANTLFYPSASLAFVFSELPAFKNNRFLSFGKIRTNWAQAGSGAPAASLVKTYNSFNLEDGTPVAFINDPGNPELRPQKTTSLEVGLEIRLFDERIGLDLSLYRTSTFDQILSLPTSPTTGFSQRTVNAGEIRNQGIELTLQVVTLRRGHFNWETNLNWAANDNQIVELYHDGRGNDITNLQLASYFGSYVNAQEGQPYGTLHGQDVYRDSKGQPIINPGTGKYTINQASQNFGSVQPDWFGGVQNTFSYKNFRLGFLVDFSKGGKFFSSTVRTGRSNGLFEETAMDGNREAGAALPGVLQATDGNGNPLFNPDGSPLASDKANDIVIPAKEYWRSLSGFGSTSAAIFDATYVKLREVSLTWDVPETWLRRIGFSRCRVALIGRNLWLMYRNLPHLDPNQIANSGNVQGFEAGMTPPARSFGVSFDFKF